MGIATLLRRLGEDEGIDIDDAELARLGLSDEDGSSVEVPDDLLSQELPGTAAGALELFLGDQTSTGTAASSDTGDGLMWYPIIREGQWAVRPGTQGQKRKIPLKIVAGNSKNQRRQIGLQDLLDAFNDKAIEYVTVPLSHNNTTAENTGLIRGMKIVDGTVKNKDGTSTKCKVLMGGYDITEPDIKGKVERGTIASRSAGILYDYVNTETGKTYPAAIEHVALTNKPWITGMTPFGRKLNASQDLTTVSLSISDEDPEAADMLAAEDVLDGIELAVGTAAGEIQWEDTRSFSWIQDKAREALRTITEAAYDARRQKQALPEGSWVVPDTDCPDWYVRNGIADSDTEGRLLVSSGYGDSAEQWVVPYTVDGDDLQLSPFTEWTSVKSVLVADPSGETPDEEVAEDADTGMSEAPELTALQLAQIARKTRGKWSGDTSNYSDSQYAAACALDRGASAGTTKERYSLPFKTPDGTIHPQGVRSAIAALLGARGGVADASDTQKQAAARTLMSAASKVGVKTSGALLSLAKVKKTTKTNASQDNPIHPRGGEQMAGSSETLVLSEDAQAAITAAEERARQAEERAEKLSQTVDRLSGSVVKGEVDTYINELKAANFNEEHGFGGVLVVVRDLMLADDGEPAVQGDNFADDNNKTGELTLSQAVRRIFDAFKRSEDGKVVLSEVVTPPSDGSSSEGGTNAGEGDGSDGKPAATDPPAEGEESSTEGKTEEELADEYILSNPEMAKHMGLTLSEAGKAKAEAAKTKNGGDA